MPLGVPTVWTRVLQRPASRWVLPNLVPLMALLLVLYRTDGSLGITYDSVMYASTRRVLEGSGSWALPSLFPPGLPLLITWVGVGHRLLVLNLGALWANLLVTHAIARKVTGSRTVALGVQAWCGLSASTLVIHSRVWSEPVFGLAVNVVLFALLHLGAGRDRRGRWLVVLVAAANVACAFRYAGLALPPAIFLALSVRAFPVRRWAGVVAAAGIAALSGSGLATVMLWNITSGERATGPRMPSVFDAGDVVGQGLQVLGAVFLDFSNAVFASVASGVLVLLLLVPAVGLAVVRTSARTVARHPGMPLLVWSLCYSALVAASELGNDLEPLSLRLLSPMLASFAILVVLVLRAALPSVPSRLLAALAGGYLAFVLISTVTWAARGELMDFELDMSSSPATRTAVASAVERFVPPRATITSDAPAWVVWITGRDLVRGAPDAGPRPSGSPAFTPRSPLLFAKPGDYVLILRGDDADARWVRLVDGDGFALYRVPDGDGGQRKPASP